MPRVTKTGSPPLNEEATAQKATSSNESLGRPAGLLWQHDEGDLSITISQVVSEAKERVAANQAAYLVELIEAAIVGLSRRMRMKRPPQSATRAMSRLQDALTDIRRIGAVAGADSPTLVLRAAISIGRSIGAIEEMTTRKHSGATAGDNRQRASVRIKARNQRVVELAALDKSASELAAQNSERMGRSKERLERDIGQARKITKSGRQ